MKAIIDDIKYVDIDPNLAQHMLDNMWYKKQRSISKAVVKKYERDMNLGEWIGHGEICVAKDGDHTDYVILNGYHTLHAIVSHGNPIPCEIKYVFCEDIDKYYARFDTGKTRPIHQIIGIDPDEIGLAKSDVSKFTSACALLIGDKISLAHKITPRHYDVKPVVRDYLDSMRCVRDILPEGSNGSVSRKLRNRNVLSVILYTMRFDRPNAIYFWTKVHSGLFDSAHDPAKRLYDYLMYNMMAGGKRYGGKAVTSSSFTKAAVICWNAYKQNRPLKQIAIKRLKKIDIVVS